METQCDVQPLQYQTNAEYHLSMEPEPQLAQYQHVESHITDLVNEHAQQDDTKQDICLISNYTTECPSKDKYSGNVKSNLDYFGSESSVFNLQNSVCSVQVERNDACNSILADGVQLTENSGEIYASQNIAEGYLESIGNAAVETSMIMETTGDEISVGQTIAGCCPVAQVDIPTEAVTTLMDVSSIGQLKKMWDTSGSLKSKKVSSTSVKAKKSSVKLNVKSKKPKGTAHVKSKLCKSNSKLIAASAKVTSQMHKSETQNMKIKHFAHREEPGPVKRGRGRPKGSKNASKSAIMKNVCKSYTKPASAMKNECKGYSKPETDMKNVCKSYTKPETAMKNVCKSYTKPASALAVHATPEERKRSQLLRVLHYKVKFLTKPCTVFLQKLEKLKIRDKSLTVDMTFPETLPEHRLETKIPEVERKIGITYKPQTVAVEPEIVKRIAKPKFNLSKYRAYLREKAKGNVECCSGDFESHLSSASEPPGCNDELNHAKVSNEGTKSDDAETVEKAVNESQDVITTQIDCKTKEQSLILLDDDDAYGGQSSDDYSLSDDDADYRPNCGSKPNKRKHKKIKWMKKPKLGDYFFDYDETSVLSNVKVKTENVSSENETVASTSKLPKQKIPAVKRHSKENGTGRIGRPPVVGHFECKLCDFTACEKNLVDKHHAVAHVQPWLQCGFCTAKFRSKNVLLEHEARNHTNEKPFKCKHEGCDYASKCPTDLQRHQSKHATEKKHVCPLCGWSTKWRRNLRSHKVMKHSTERKFHCNQCSFTAKRNSDLKQHMFRHSSEKPLKCEICGFCVKTNWEIKSHMLTHSTEKPFKCMHPGCTAATKTRADLNKHMRKHATDRPFKCETCSSTYKDQAGLNKHKQYMHVTGRNFKCNMCDKAFKTKPALRKHLDTHAGIRRFKCDVCDIRFITNSAKMLHMKTHDTSTRPFPCPLCPYAAKIQHHLLAHIGTMHGDSYTYYCELCRKPFKRHSMLQLHYRRMHSQREVDSLNNYSNRSQVDLALLKMEMKLDLEEADHQRSKYERKGMKKSRVNASEVEIKEEPPDDEDYSIEIRRDTPDKMLSHVTGKVEHVTDTIEMTLQENPSNETPLNATSSQDVFDSPEAVTETAEPLQICQNKSEVNSLKMTEVPVAEGTSSVTESNGSAASAEDEDLVLKVSQSIATNEGSENTTNVSEVIVEESENNRPLATLALYDGFRLPLATKGFAFNYDKNGKKPRAWFMDINCMNPQYAEKMRAYLRRKGLMAPLPRGKRKKTSGLTAFVQNRKRKLQETIWKSNLQKMAASKVNEARRARFKGTYSEMESLNVDELEDIGGLIPPEEDVAQTAVDKAINTNSQSTKAMNMHSQPQVVKHKRGRPPKTSQNDCKSEISKKGSTVKKQKVGMNSTKPKKPRTKLLLSTEKKAQKSGKQKKKKKLPVVIRKPAFLQKKHDDLSKKENTCAKKQNIRKNNNEQRGRENEQIKNINSKKENVAKKAQIGNERGTKRGRPLKQMDERPKQSYNKKYVPAKKRQKLDVTSPRKVKSKSNLKSGNCGEVQPEQSFSDVNFDDEEDMDKVYIEVVPEPPPPPLRPDVNHNDEALKADAGLPNESSLPQKQDFENKEEITMADLDVFQDPTSDMVGGLDQSDINGLCSPLLGTGHIKQETDSEVF